MELKKFFAPSWNKVILFFAIIVIANFMIDLAFIGIEDPANDVTIAMNSFIVGIVFYPARTLFNGILGIDIIGVFSFQASIIYLIANAIDLAWQYLWASIIVALIEKVKK